LSGCFRRWLVGRLLCYITIVVPLSQEPKKQTTLGSAEHSIGFRGDRMANCRTLCPNPRSYERSQKSRFAIRRAPRIPTRPRSRHLLASIPRAGIQDASFPERHGRPLADAVHAHHGSYGDDRSRSRSWPFTIWPSRRNRAEPVDERTRWLRV
jgi:hypothetical protein